MLKQAVKGVATVPQGGLQVGFISENIVFKYDFHR